MHLERKPNQENVSGVFKLRLSLSGACNYNCIFCHNEGRNSFSNDLMSKDDALALCQGAYDAGIRSFTFTGGEPLMNPDCLNIISEVRKDFPDVIIKLTTNAVLIKIADVDFLEKNIDRIRINFQATDGDYFKEIVGVDKLEHLKKLISEFKNTNIHICLNYVYTKVSKKNLPSVVDYATKNSLEMKVLELIKNDNNKHYYEPIESAKNYLEKISIRTVKDYQDDDLYFLKKNGPKIRLCYAHCNTLNGNSCRTLGELRTSPSLDVYPCMHHMTPKINVSKNMSTKNICNAVLLMDEEKGVCPECENE